MKPNKQIRTSSSTLLIATAFLGGCVADDDGLEAETTETEQQIGGWAAAGWGTTTDLYGMDTGWSSTNSACVLTAVKGDLNEGGYWQVADETSTVSIEVDQWNDNWRLIAHGGAHTSQSNSKVWANNPVAGGAVCFPGDVTHYGSWRSVQPHMGQAGPKKITGLSANRRCFLNSVHTGDGMWSSISKYARVRKYTSTDASHPTTGWYIESNLQSSVDTGAHALVGAVCVEFPAIEGEWGHGIGGAGTWPMTDGNGRKMCGLTGISGAFTTESYSSGVNLTPPSSQTGNWSLTLTANKGAEVLCIQ